MAMWHRGSLAGFTSDKVEVTGKIIGQRPGAWFFHDGIGTRWISKEHSRWRPLSGGFGILTIPAWLDRHRSVGSRPKKFSKWSSGTKKGRGNEQSGSQRH